MMAHLVDTSILARLANTADALHAVAARAVLELHQRGEVLHVTAQNLIEFRNLATGDHMAITGIVPQLRTTDMASSIRFYTEKLGVSVEFTYGDFYTGIRAASQIIHLK